MKTVLARTTGRIMALAILLACLAGALAPAPAPDLGMVTTIVWLLGAGGAICLLLRRVIDAEDSSRDLATRLAREVGARQQAEDMLVATQTVLSKVVRQQETARDGERGRIAREIQDDLGQTLLALRIELSLLQLSSSGIHPAVHQKATAMIGTLDLALRSLRGVVNELRPLAEGSDLADAVAALMEEFTHQHGIAHQFEAAACLLETPRASSDGEADALVYRALQEALAELAHGASATEVHVSLGRDSGGLTLRIDDNAAPAPQGEGGCRCGLAGMRERIEALGGSLRIAAAAGIGTTRQLTLPVAHGVVSG